MSTTQSSTKTVFSTNQSQPTDFTQTSDKANQKTPVTKSRNLYQPKPPKKPTPRNLYPAKPVQVDDATESGHAISIEMSDTESHAHSDEERFPLERENEKFEGDVRDVIEERKEQKLGPPGNKPNFERNHRPRDWNRNKRNDRGTKKFKGSPSKQRRAVAFIPVARERRRNRIEELERQLAKAKEAIKCLSTRNNELYRQQLQLQQQQSLSFGGQMFYQNPVMMMQMPMQQQQPQMVFNQTGSLTNYMPVDLQNDQQIEAFLQS